MRYSEKLIHRFAPLVILGAIGLTACGESTAPGTDLGAGEQNAAAATLAANTWTPRAVGPFQGEGPGEELFGFALAEATNAAGRSIVYALGGTFPARGGAVNSSVVTYDPASDTWGGAGNPRVGVFHSNGAGRLGNRIFLTGGYNEPGTLPTFTNRLQLYDYAAGRIIQKAAMPFFTAEGVSGVINGKLYVMPGACSGDLYPNPGYCEKESTRRLFRYDPATNAWSTLRRADNYHRMGAAGVMGGKLYVAGGLGENKQGLANLDVYDPKSNQWRALAPLPTAGPAVGTVLQGRFFVVVSGAGGVRAYAYTPATNRWQAKAAPGFFGSIVRVTLDGRPHLFMANGTRSALYTP